ncbi:hypothetical protein Tco_1274276 [Tanacetum coccineum]
MLLSIRYLTEVIPFFNLLKEHFNGVQRSLVKEVRAMKAVFENMEAEEVFYTVTDSVLTASQFHELNVVYDFERARAVKLKAENSKLLEKIQKDDHDSMVKYFSKLEIDHLHLQLKYQHLKENIGNFKSKTSKDAPEFDAFFELNKHNDQLQAHINTIRKLKDQISQLKLKNSNVVDHKSLESQNIQLKESVTALQERIENYKAENEKVKRHYLVLFDSIKVTRFQIIEKTTSLLNEIENLKSQLKGKMPCVTSDVATPKVSACDKYAIDVEPIPPHSRNNREVHLDYLKHLKESVETLREIVEEAKVERPLDRSLASACLYTKHS